MIDDLDSLDDLLNEFINGHGAPWVVFVGAGVSYASGIPIVAPLVESVMRRVGATKAEIEHVFRAGIPFELFVETLGERIDIRRLLSVFESTRPTFYHHMLAHLMASNRLRTIVTTNYDTLIEQALGKVGLTVGKEYQVYLSPDRFAAIDWNSEERRILKLHGCVSDKESACATLAQVAGNRLTASIRPVIDFVFGNDSHRVLVMGYSCSDHFDVSPAIRTLGRHIADTVLIDHSDLPKSRWRLESLASKISNNPFRSAVTGLRYYVKTDSICQAAWARNSMPRYVGNGSQRRTDSSTWKRKIAEWLRDSGVQASRALACHLRARLLIRANRWDTARRAMSASLDAARNKHDHILVAQACLNLGICYYRLGELSLALKHQRMALRYGRRLRLDKLEAQSVGNIGNVHYSANRLALALRYQQLCLDLSKRLGLRQLQANTLGNIGIILDSRAEYSVARRYHLRAERLARQIGDPIGEARHRLNIAHGYRSAGKGYEANQSYRRAEILATTVAQDELVAACLLGRGQSIDWRHRRAEAEVLLREALNISLRTAERLTVLKCYEVLAKFYQYVEDMAKARAMLRRGIALANRQRNAVAARQLSRQLVIVEATYRKSAEPRQRGPTL